MRVAVAGGGRGIGAACVRALRRRGDAVVVCARTAGEVEALAQETGAVAVVADLSTDAGARAFATAAGAVDLALVCVGGAHRGVLLAEADRETLLGQFAQNAVAPALAAGALLRAGARRVLFLGSLATRRPPLPGTAPYTASKAALDALVRAFAEEAWPVPVNAIALGPVRTSLHEVAGTPPDWLAQLPAPDEVVPLVLAAASAPSSLVLDGDALAQGPIGLCGDGRLAEAEPLPESATEAEPGRRPSPRVRAAVRASAGALHRYPRGGDELRRRLAAVHGVPPECVALSGGGASELLERCLRAFCARGDEVVSPFPTFELLSALCTREGLRHKPVFARRTPDGLFGPHDPDALLAALGPRTRLVYVASPDNPTGAQLVRAAEERFTVLPLVLDEAWSLEWGPLPLTALRLRSLSKVHGLAGLRVGYAVGPAPLVDALRRLELPFPLGAPQIAALLAALEQPERPARAALLLARERTRVAAALRALGFAVSESPAPVLLVRGKAAPRLAVALRTAGIAVQDAHWDPACIALALGRRTDNARLIEAASRSIRG